MSGQFIIESMNVLGSVRLSVRPSPPPDHGCTNGWTDAKLRMDGQTLHKRKCSK